MRGALEVRLVFARGSLGLADLVVGHRPLLERVVARSRLPGRELAQQRQLDVAVAAWKRGQRGWKTQAGGGAIGDGTSPVSTIRSRPPVDARGTAESSAAVYGCFGCS